MSREREIEEVSPKVTAQMCVRICLHVRAHIGLQFIFVCLEDREKHLALPLPSTLQ